MSYSQERIIYIQLYVKYDLNQYIFLYFLEKIHQPIVMNRPRTVNLSYHIYPSNNAKI